MSGSVRILLFGNDALLLKSRQMVLESAGYEVYVAPSILALTHILANHPASHPIYVLILCHSLTGEQCNRAQSIGREHFPQMKVVILAVNGLVSHTAEGDSVVDTAEGPKSLLSTVEELVKNGMPPESWPGRSENGSRASA